MKKGIYAEVKVLFGSGHFGCISNKKFKLFNKYNSNCAY
ncbi:hypothetical protein Clocel_2416 [Clostridium cellulovorans 743B]|uniref:Uncharacterized protein n=1 Tax=Clostridium cellulovorans (strain ATCC 35296 / DSM 3052 / OCM 3 / 743B) TaxID=573061 RepID=D9SPZ5_CLOC7|nr:hypothetical protein Clocel_2416 [Clostridium cellulovorans 743B]